MASWDDLCTAAWLTGNLLDISNPDDFFLEMVSSLLGVIDNAQMPNATRSRRSRHNEPSIILLEGIEYRLRPVWFCR